MNLNSENKTMACDKERVMPVYTLKNAHRILCGLQPMTVSLATATRSFILAKWRGCSRQYIRLVKGSRGSCGCLIFREAARE